MAILDSSFGFLGTIGNLTAYRIPGKEGIIVKRKSAVPRHVLKTSAAFENSRRMSTEFGGRSTMAGLIARATRPLQNVTHESITGPLNALLRAIQELDNVSHYGERHVLLTRGKSLLEGFQLNRQVALESVLRCNISCNLTRERGIAEVHVPSLLAGVNFRPHPAKQWFRIVAVLGMVPDMMYTRNGYKPAIDIGHAIVPVVTTSEWLVCVNGSETIQLTATLAPPFDERVCLLLTVGVQYGKLTDTSIVEPLKNSGTAKVMLVG